MQKKHLTRDNTKSVEQQQQQTLSTLGIKGNFFNLIKSISKKSYSYHHAYWRKTKCFLSRTVSMTRIYIHHSYSV